MGRVIHIERRRHFHSWTAPDPPIGLSDAL
jgi:hypothetical protein